MSTQLNITDVDNSIKFTPFENRTGQRIVGLRFLDGVLQMHISENVYGMDKHGKGYGGFTDEWVDVPQISVSKTPNEIIHE